MLGIVHQFNRLDSKAGSRIIGSMIRGALKRRIAWVALWAVVLAMTPWEAIWSRAVDDHEQHTLSATSAPCPDESPDHEPCPDGCLCLCCPGHTSVLIGAVEVLLISGGGGEGLADQRGLFLPDEVSRRVFRPPRAA